MRRARSATCLALFLLLAIAPSRAGAVVYRQAVSNYNKMGLGLTNYGVLGNNFTSRAPSLEYPLGTGFEHMVHAGLWFGAVRVDGGFTGVTTAAVDGYPGQNLALGCEFTPSADDIYGRSDLPWSRWYVPGAVSEQDYITQFDDLGPAGAGSLEPHAPLGIRVTQYVYNWSYWEYAHMVFLRYVIQNVGAGPLTNAWVGLYSELASGDKNAGTGVSWWTGWFNKKWLVYDADLRMVREHYCLNQPVPSACQLQRVPYWAGVQLLTPPDASSGQRVTLAAWPWAAGSPARDQDAEKYAIMSAGTIVNTAADSLMPFTGDPVELLALGPFPVIAAGDSIIVDFALVGGAEPDTIRRRAGAAQRFRDAGFQDAVVATETSLLSADASAAGVRLRWDVARDPGASVRVERSDDGATWELLAELTPVASGELEYTDRAVGPGERHAYRAGAIAGGELRYSAATWVDVPLAPRFALHGARPNPAPPGQGALGFSLAESGAARLECFDLLGRREASVELGVLEPGGHVVPLARLGALRPAVHVVRLTQGGSVATARIVTVR